MKRETGLLRVAGCLFLGFAIFAMIFLVFTFTDIHKSSDDIAINDWKFAWGSNGQKLEGDIKQWSLANADSPVRKPPETLYKPVYVRLNTVLPEIGELHALKLITAGNPVKVLINGSQVYNNRYGTALYTGNRVNIINLPKAGDRAEIDIFMSAPYSFSLSASVTPFNTSTGWVGSIDGLMASGVYFAVAMISLVILVAVAIKIKNGRALIWLSLTYIAGGAGALMSQLSLFYPDLSSPVYFKIQLLLLLLTAFFMNCTTIAACGKWKTADKAAVIPLLMAAVAFVFLSDTKGLLVVAVFPVILFVTAISAVFKFRNSLCNRYEHAFTAATAFLVGFFCILFDSVSFFIGWATDLIELRHFGVAIYCSVMFFVLVRRALLRSIRDKEHSQLVSRNNLWVEKAVSCFAGVFSQQSISGFCRETARAVKELVLFDNEIEGSGNQSPEDLHISMALIQGGQYGNIYTENQTEVCSYERIMVRAQNSGDKPVLFGEHTLDMLLYSGNTPTCILHIDGIEDKPSTYLQNTLKNSYTSIIAALNSLELKENIVELQENVFINLAEIAEQKQAGSGAHLRIVAEMVKVICDELDMSEHEKHVVVMASMVHDIGKLAIPEAIISKKGKLTDDEFAIMQDHVIYGYNILSKSPGEFMSAASVIAQQHHEKYDGTGYIELSGEQIHLYARIVAIADVLDALLSERSYKRAWTEEQACKYIQDNAGAHFDPKLVEKFRDCKHKLISIKKHYS